jgi:hypothetical protein
MMLTAFSLLCVVAAPVFDVHSFPISGPDSIAFLAHADADSVADLFVAEAGQITVYPSVLAYKSVSIPLPDGVSAFDVADVDGDGRGEVVAVCGDSIVLCPIPIDGKDAHPRTLFTLHTLLSGLRRNPVPMVLVVHHADQVVLVLPCETSLEVKTLAGETVVSYPTGPDAPRRVSYGRPFESWSHEPPQLGPRTALDIEVSRVLDFEPELPSDLLPIASGPPNYRHGTPAQARDASREDAAAWPWFPLTRTGGSVARVLYAASESGDTLIRLMQASDAQSPREATRLGPLRQYPGLPIVIEDAAPDFNGDGAADLLLWKAPAPAVSLDALTQAVTSASWPIRITAHLFSPEKNSYEAKPFARIERRIPLTWFLNMEGGSPLRHCVMRDFDGDGKTDLAFCGDERTLLIWASGQGFQGEPAQTVSFQEPITGVEFQEDVDGKGRSSLGIRTAHGLHVLHAKL